MENEQETYYGAEGSNDNRHLRERLRGFYSEEDLVNVINIDTKPLKYQFTKPTDREDASTAGGKLVIQHRNPKVVTLQPGQARLCPAYEADRMLEDLIKQVTINKAFGSVKGGSELDHRATADWSNYDVQKAIIKEALLGKEDIFAERNEPNAIATEVGKDLEIRNELQSRPAL